MSSIRPGNKERGWNDPPELLHLNSSQDQTVNKNLLNKRVNYNFNQANSAPTQDSTKNSLEVPLLPPSANSKPSAIVKSQEIKSNECTSEKQIIDLNIIENVLKTKVDFLKEKGLPIKITDEIIRRITMFSTSWDKLSEPVKVKMNELTNYLNTNEFDKANDIHLKLIMDYASEVSVWMVGIKKLIHELKEN